MSILFVGNQVDDFGAAWVDSTATTNTARDTAFSPSAMLFTAPSGNDDSSPGFINLSANPSGDVWLHFRYRTPVTTNSAVTDGHILSFRSATGDLLARFDALDGNYRAHASGDTAVFGSNFALAAATVMTFDIKLTVGANIVIEIYQNGVLASSATAANTGNKGLCRQVVFDFFDVQSIANHTIHLSEVILTDEAESTIGWRLATFTPTSQGFYNEWAGDFSHITNGQDGRFILSTAANQKESWINSNYGGPGSPASIRAVVAKFHSDKGPTGPQNIVPFLRIGSVDYEAASQVADFSTRQLGVWSQNPATASNWTVAALSGLEIGVKSA